MVRKMMVQILCQHPGQKFGQFVRLLQLAIAIELLQGLAALMQIGAVCLVNSPAADLLEQKAYCRNVLNCLAQTFLREFGRPGRAFARKILGLSQPGPAELRKRLFAARRFPNDGERQIEAGERHSGVGKTVANPDQKQVGIGLRLAMQVEFSPPEKPI